MFSKCLRLGGGYRMKTIKLEQCHICYYAVKQERRISRQV